MLTVYLNALLTSARDALLHGSPSQRAAVAEQINEVLTDHAKAILTNQRSGGRGRTPCNAYKVAVSGGPVTTVLGAKAALAALQQVLASYGHGRRAPALATLQVALSRAGQWGCTIATPNGDLQITVSKAT